MDKIHKDLFLCIVCLLDFRAFIKACLVCAHWRSHCAEYISTLDAKDRGYRLRGTDNEPYIARLIKEFTCRCGARNWDVRNGCSCWQQCCNCFRVSSYVVTRQYGQLQNCVTGCICFLSCRRCDRRIDQMNRTRFRAIIQKSMVFKKHKLRGGMESEINLICTDCLQSRVQPCQGIRRMIWSVTKGFIAWRIIRISSASLYVDVAPLAKYRRKRDKEYIELVRKILGREDPDSPVLALLETFT